MVIPKGFFGVWELQPEPGGPTSAVYTLLPSDDGHVDFHVRWTADGETRSLAFRHAVRLEGDTLITEVIEDGVVKAWAGRTLDGHVLTVVQRDAHGSENRSVYHRATVKQVIVYRRDLKMRKGKIAAQVAHASLRVILTRDRATGFVAEIPMEGPVAWWVRSRFTKVVLAVDTEEDLLKVHELAKEAGIPTSLIRDAGRTEFGGVPTYTTVAVGPWVAGAIDAITGKEGAVPTKLA